jgi:hypothetical protein
MGKQPISVALALPDQKEGDQQLTPLLKRANAIVIQTDADYTAAGVGMQKADAFLNSPIVAAFKKHAADAGAVHKQAVALRDHFVKGAQEVKRILGEKRVAYDQKKTREAEAKRIREGEKLRLQAIEEAKEVAKTIRREDPQAAKAIVEQAKAAPAPSLPSRPAVPKEAGFVTTTTYGFEIEDPEKVPMKYFSIDESLIRTDVNNFGLDANIPGVRVWPIVKQHTRGAA